MKKPLKSGRSAKPQAVPEDSRRKIVVHVLVHAILVTGAVALFAPLFVHSSFYYLFSFFKSIIFRAAVQLMLLLYVVLAALSPANRPRFQLVSYALFAWFGAMFISSLPGVSADAWNSWWGDFRRMGGMVTQLHLLTYFIILSQVLKRQRDWLILFTAALFSGLLMGFSGMVQYLELDYLYRFPQQFRIEGAAGNANFFAAQMLLNFFVALWFLSLKEKQTAYPLSAKAWLVLLVATDVFACAWDLFTGSRILAGLFLAPVAVFVLVLHVAGILWFLLRRSVLAGQIAFASMGVWFLFWMYYTQTRGAVVGLVVSLFFFGIGYLWIGAGKRMKLVCGGLVVLLLLGPAIALLSRQSAWMQSHPLLVRYTSLSLQDASAESRLMAWRSSVRAIAHRPLFGWGPENFSHGFNLYFPSEIYRGLMDEVWFDRAHNLLMDVGMTTGLAGLAVYVGFYGLVLFLLIRRWYQTREATNGFLSALLLAYLAQGLFTFDTINTDVLLYLALAYISFTFTLAEPRAVESARNQHVGKARRWLAWVPAAAAVIVLPTVWSHAVVRPFVSNRFLQQARNATKELDPKTQAGRIAYLPDTIRLFQLADNYQTTGRREVREEFADYAFDLARAEHVPLESRVSAIMQAVSLLRKSIEEEPANVREYLYLATFMNGTLGVVRQADPESAEFLAKATLSMLQKAANLSPLRPHVYFEQSQTLLLLGRADERLAAFEKGAALCLAIKEPHIDLIALYISAGRYEDAAKQWQYVKSRGFQLTRADYGRITNAYVAVKQFAPVVELYKEQLLSTPGDAELLARLASAYRDMGEFDLARQTALKAAALSPKAAAGIQEFLNSIKKPDK